MLKKTIIYIDFDGNTQKEDFFFHLSKIELAELSFMEEGGFAKYLERIVKAGDNRAILQSFRRIIELAYGVRSEDGRRFIKAPDLYEAFVQTNAYDALLMELVGDANAAAEFVRGVVPTDLGAQVDLNQLELPDEPAPTLTDTLDDPEPWLTENRNPTKAELVSMTKEQLTRAMAAKARRQAQTEIDQEVDRMRKELEGE